MDSAWHRCDVSGVSRHSAALVSPGKGKSRPVRLDETDRHAAGGERLRRCAIASATRSRRNSATPRPGGGRAHGADLAFAGRDRGAGFGRGAVVAHRHGAGARGAAMLHPRHHLLADIAALGEIDAAELVHVGLVRKGVAVAEIDAAARHAERDAMRFVFARVDERRAELGRRRGGKMRRQHHAQPERRQPRIGIAQAVFGRCRPPSQAASTPSVSDKILDRSTLARNL